MFFDVFNDLCKNKGISCKRAAEDIGLSNSITTKWKKTGATPKGETLNRIATYFDVSIDFLMSGLVSERTQHLANGISVYESYSSARVKEMMSDVDWSENRIVYEAPGICVVIENDTNATNEEIADIIKTYQNNNSVNNETPLEAPKRSEGEEKVLSLFNNIPEELRDDAIRYWEFLAEKGKTQ